jgi:hypothetical protein
MVLSDPNGLWFSCGGNGGAKPAGVNTVLNAINSATNAIASLFCGGGGGGDDGGGGGWMRNPPTSGHYITVSAYRNEVMGLGHMGDALDSDNTSG